MTDAEKLRLVLDYVPCERCLAAAVPDQQLYCSLCARLHRQVGIRVATRTTVLVERPAPPPAPVLITPPDVAPAPATDAEAVAPSPPPVAATPPVEVVFEDGSKRKRAEHAALEIVVEPYEEPAAAPLVAPAPVVEPVPAAADEPEWDDVASFAPPDDLFEFRREEAPPAPVAPARAEERERPAPPPVRAPEPEIPEDDFVFRPPEPEEPRAFRDDPIDVEPTQEVEVRPAETPWERTTDFLADEVAQPTEAERWGPPPEEARVEPVAEPAPEPVAEPEPQPVPPPAALEDDIVETEIVEDVVEMEVLPEEPPVPPARDSDLYRLRGFTDAHYRGLASASIQSLEHLAGHDPNELATRVGIPAEMLVPWVQVANLVHEAGVPIDASVAMVAAGVAGPRGLREMDADAIVDKVAAFAGVTLSARDIKRWKRRV